MSVQGPSKVKVSIVNRRKIYGKKPLTQAVVYHKGNWIDRCTFVEITKSLRRSEKVAVEKAIQYSLE